MNKKNNKNHNETEERSILSQLMPEDEYSIHLMDDRAKLLSVIEKDEHSIRQSMTSYIKFILGKNEIYGIPYHDVLDVKAAENITKVPMSPQFIVGISYWHGKLIPIVDLANYFEIKAAHDENSERVIAAIANEKFIIGLIFDDVSGVDSYSIDSLDGNLAVNTKIKDQYVYGIHDGKFTILNVKNILADISSELMRK